MAKYKPGQKFLLEYTPKHINVKSYVTVELLGSHEGNAQKNGYEVTLEEYGKTWITIAQKNELIPADRADTFRRRN